MIHLTETLLIDLISSEGENCTSVFNSQQVPNMPLSNYMSRIHHYTKYSPSCLIIAIIYIDRYNMAKEDFSLNWHNVHRVLLTSIMLAVKFHDDIYFENHAFEKGGGINTSELKTFELEIWKHLDFNAFVRVEEYEAFRAQLVEAYRQQPENNQWVKKPPWWWVMYLFFFSTGRMINRVKKIFTSHQNHNLFSISPSTSTPHRGIDSYQGSCWRSCAVGKSKEANLVGFRAVGDL